MTKTKTVPATVGVSAFDLLTSKATVTESKTAKKKTKEIVDVADLEFTNALVGLATATAAMKKAEAEVDMANSIVLPKAKELFIKKCKTSKVKPESFYVRGMKGVKAMAQGLLIVMDKYLTIKDEATGEDLMKRYPKYVESVISYSIDSQLMEKYKDIIPTAILAIINNPKIAEEDRANLLKISKKYVVKKGSLDMFAADSSIEALMEELKPVSYIKGAELLS